jgi:hypothetical protein
VGESVLAEVGLTGIEGQGKRKERVIDPCCTNHLPAGLTGFGIVMVYWFVCMGPFNFIKEKSPILSRFFFDTASSM